MGTFSSSRAGKRANAVGNSVVRMAAWLSYGGNSEGIHQGVRWHSIPSRSSRRAAHQLKTPYGEAPVLRAHDGL